MSVKKSTSDRILETADRLFYGQGTAVGVDTLAAEAGVSKRTLYNHYPSKDALIEAYLTRRIRPIPTSDKPPAQQILDGLIKHFHEFRDGRRLNDDVTVIVLRRKAVS